MRKSFAFGVARWSSMATFGLLACHANIAVVGETPEGDATPREDISGAFVATVDAGPKGGSEVAIPFDTYPPPSQLAEVSVEVSITSESSVGETGNAGPLHQLDLLLVVDNSLSMADSQAELSKRIPVLLKSLGTDGGFNDIHVGVITSSLGSHGTAACNPNTESGQHPEFNDRGHLLPRSDTVGASPLTWTNTGDGSLNVLQARTAQLVASATELGCGYEETWESLYRFLVDPAPYVTADAANCTGSGAGQRCDRIIPSGIDQTILNQRAAFLRPDSLLAVVVVSNENDFSLKPVDFNWIPWGVEKRFAQLRGSEECKSIPDDFEPENQAELPKLGCKTCLLNPDMPICNTPWPSGADPNVDSDNRNLRGFHQVQRFGYNFLYGRDRYVSAFHNPSAPVADVYGMTKDSQGRPYSNPIFSGGRTPDKVVVATLVGVPRNLVENPNGTLKTPEWDRIVGPIAVRDPHMIESIEMRSGLGKYNGDIKADDPTCPDGRAGCGNGGERVIPDGSDLQFACIGERSSTEIGPLNTDCPKEEQATDEIAKNPLCKGPGNQPFFKAYPGLRHLRIARELGSSAVVGSFCNADQTQFFNQLASVLRAKAGH